MLQVLDGVATKCVAKQDKAATGQAWQVFLAPDQIVRAAGKLFDAGFSLEDIFAMDFEEGFLVTYHFNRWDKDERLALRVLADRENPVVPSIASVFQGAEWHERETRDFHGVVFEGNPNLVPLFMPVENADLFPLRKTDKVRKPMGEVLSLGEVVSCSPEVEALFAEKEAGEASEA